MGVFNWWKKETRSEEIGEFDDLEEMLLSASVKDGRISIQQALNIPSFAAGIDLISDVVASLPVKLFIDNSGKIEEVKDDSRIALLNDETGDLLNGFDFKKALVMDYFLYGAGYAYINKKRNTIKSLHYVERSHVGVYKNADPIFKKANFLVNGQTYYDFEFLKLLRKTRDGVTGVSFVEEQNDLLSVMYNMLIFEKLLIKTGGNKKGFLKSDKNISKDAIKALRSGWARLYSNEETENVIVLNNGVDFKEASLSSVEMQLNENKRSNADEINRLLRLPKGIIDEEAIKNCIQPLLVAIETAFNKDLLLVKEKKQMFYFAFDTKELVKADIEKRFKAYAEAINAGWLQMDEVRYLENYAPLDLNFIKLSLKDVLFNPETKEIYTPNTDKKTVVDDSGSDEENADDLKGGEEI